MCADVERKRVDRVEKKTTRAPIVWLQRSFQGLQVRSSHVTERRKHAAIGACKYVYNGHRGHTRVVRSRTRIPRSLCGGIRQLNTGASRRNCVVYFSWKMSAERRKNVVHLNSATKPGRLDKKTGKKCGRGARYEWTRRDR